MDETLVTLGARIKQHAEAHTTFLHGLVELLLVQRPQTFVGKKTV